MALTQSSRRSFIQYLLASPLILSSAAVFGNKIAQAQKRHSLKISLNAFSFNDPLSKETMTLDDLIVFCSMTGFAAVDITAYYFKGYPVVPDNDYLYHVKRKAFGHGLEISGTGVRNDFTEPDTEKRKESVKLVKSWIEAAEKIGAPVLRIFAGAQKPQQYSRQQVMDWMLTDIKTCIDHGKQHGVVVAIQNHDDFIRTSGDALEILKAINSEWFGLILDTGSFRSGDPYAQIKDTAPYAVNWQVKEKIFVNGKEVDVDIDRLLEIIKGSGYKGYIPLETLGEGDPKTKVTSLFNKVSTALLKT